MATLDTDVLIIGAGMSGLGLAVQLIRKFNHRNFEIIEKVEDVGGTWNVNTYPNCGCDVASHFYSYSFELNPDWSQKFSMQSEIQAYFRGVAEKYNIVPHIRFNSMVEIARWDEAGQFWEVSIKNQKTKETKIKRARIVASAVGNLSIPKKCEISGADNYKGHLFHSALWDHSFDYHGKDAIVLGNGCSATQFVPAMAEGARKVTQFTRQPHFLAERPNPVYSPTWKAFMRYMPFAMRLYRFYLYAQMEQDLASLEIGGKGSRIREGLKVENERYVKKMAPEKYWDALIPKYEIGCKRKVMDTDYLACLHRSNVELIPDDPVEEITETGVRTKSGREVSGDAIIQATGFDVYRMLFPMKIIGEGGVSLNEYWDTHYQGAAQSYLGTLTPGFPNFFTLMGPNTVTGHLSVIYTVECQINFILRLIEPVLRTEHPQSLALTSPRTSAVDVKASAAKEHSNWLQNKLSKLVWASGCTSWFLDPKTGLNIAMYPEYQFIYWLRSVFIKGSDFEWIDSKTGKRKSMVVGGWKTVQRTVSTALVLGIMAGGAFRTHQAGSLRGVEEAVRNGLGSVIQHGRDLLKA